MIRQLVLAVVAASTVQCGGTDPIDWPTLTDIFHSWATQGSYSWLDRSVIALYDQMRLQGRTVATEPCALGWFAAVLAAVGMTVPDETLVFAVHDVGLLGAYESFSTEAWDEVADSMFGRPIFALLSSFSRRAQTVCPSLAAGEDPDPSYLVCVVEKTTRPVRIGGSGAGWCHASLQGPEVLELLSAGWGAAVGDKPTVRLSAAALGYFMLDQSEGCAEAEAVAYLAAVLAGEVARTEGLRLAQQAIGGLGFVRAVLTRWPLWELWEAVSALHGGRSRVTVTSCLTFAPCPRSVPFYVAQRSPLPEACPQSLVTTQYAGGVLSILLPEGVDPSSVAVEIMDVSLVRQRLRVHEAEDFAGWGQRTIAKTVTVAIQLPLTLGVEGIRVRSDLHDSAEVHIAPQRRSHFAARHLGFRAPRPPSIYLLILESASAAAFHAYNPATVASWSSLGYLSVSFPRFHALLGGTPENMMPALSGFAYDERLNTLRRSSWDCEAVRQGVPSERMLWNVLKHRGYVTGFGATGCNGIVGTRYCERWMAEFDHVAPSLELDANCRSQNEWAESFTAGKGCIGGRRPHDHLLTYMEGFFQAYEDAPTFAYAHLETAHEFPQGLQLLDTRLAEHLKVLAALPEGARPMVILAGDHGPPRDCDQRTPLVQFLIPPEMASGPMQAGFDNLKSNQYRLASWFDVYSTVIHLATAAPRFQSVSAPPRWDTRGHATRSLLEPLPVNRTCEQAGIPEWQCGCSQGWVEWCPASEATLQGFVNGALKRVNEMMRDTLASLHEPRSRCPELTLVEFEACEAQVSGFRGISDGAESGEGIIRVRFTTGKKMRYEMYAYLVFDSRNGGLSMRPRELFNFNPLSLYRPHEACTPVGVDPAYCPCGIVE
mmetsp:Transcript_91368/g.209358  ORF Transcript_91368/g.209358 Transcript_91368/m.209358 type:complete len:883 (+) Transcript_91368:58-2706(+)